MKSAAATTTVTLGVLKLLLVLVAVSTVVLGQDAAPNSNNACAAECGEVQKRHDKCVADYWTLDEQSKTVAETVRGEERQQWEAQLQAAQTELANIQRLAKEEFESFQAKEVAFHQQNEEQQRAHEQALTKLQDQIKRKDEDISKAKKDAKAIRKELAAMKQEMEEMVASKTIITIDYGLLLQRVEEIKVILMTHLDQAKAFLQEQLTFVTEKAVEFWHYIETEIVPEIVKFLEQDVLPFCRSTWKQAQRAWEDFYAPHREPVNQHIQTAKTAVAQSYQEHVEPHVKKHKIDQHAAHAKAQAEMYMVLAHSELVNGIDSGTGVALNFVKLQEWPQPMVDGLSQLHADPEQVATYLEAFVLGVVLLYFFKWLLTPKPKPKKPKKTKKQWEVEQASMKMKNGGNYSNGKKKRV